MSGRWQLKNHDRYSHQLVFEPTIEMASHISKVSQEISMRLAEKEEEMIFSQFTDEQLKNIIRRARRELSFREKTE